MENEKTNRYRVVKQGEPISVSRYKYNPDAFKEMWNDDTLLMRVNKEDKRYVEYNEYVKSIEGLPVKEFDIWTSASISTERRPDGPDSWNPPVADDESLRPYFSNNSSPYFSLEVNENILTVDGMLSNKNVIMIPHHKKNKNEPVMARTFLEAVFKIMGVIQINPIDYFNKSDDYRNQSIINTCHQTEQECIKASELPIKAWCKFTEESYEESFNNYNPDDPNHPSYVGLKLPMGLIDSMLSRLEESLRNYEKAK